MIKIEENKDRFDERLKNMTPKVMGADLIPKPYNDDKILEALKRETGLEGEKANELVEMVSRYLISNKIRIITAPMIREVVNSFCLKYNLEVIRLKHTRVGIPKWDLDNIYKNNGNIDYIKESIELIENTSNLLKKSELPVNMIKDKINNNLEKINNILCNYYKSSDYLILKHIKKENKNIDNLIKVLEDEKNGN